MTLLENALQLAGIGYPVFPCNINKSPMTKNGYKDASRDPTVINQWWTDHPHASIGVPTGEITGIFALDVDQPDGPKSLTEVEQENGKLPITSCQRTGGGGFQYFFKHPGWRVKNSVSKIGPGLDLRGDGGYTIFPPSSHPSGHQYEWICSEPATDAPEWLLEQIETECTTIGTEIPDEFEQWLTSRLHNPVSIVQSREMLRHIGKAEDYDQWIKVGMALHSQWMDEGLPLWLEWSSQAANFDEEVCRSKWPTFAERSGKKVTMGTLFYLAKEGGWSPAEAGDEHLTDTGNAQRLVRLYRDQIRYCHEFKTWMIWDGQRWAPDTDGSMIQYGIKSARKYLEEATAIDDEDIRRMHRKWALNSESKLRLEATIAIAKSLQGVTIHPDQLDQDPFLLNVENGTLDLQTGKLRPHCRTDYITRLVKITYTKNKEDSSQWLQFLEEVMEGDVALIGYLQRVVGYCLTSDIREQCLFFLHGYGANGKSTFINVLSLLLGDYETQTSSETFMIKQNTGGATPELAILAGKRVVTANETEEGRLLAEATIKQLCGGDQITARPLYGAPFTFLPTFKIVIAGNYKPQIRGGDHGIWRRIHLVPFTVTIPPKQQDKMLYERLKAELPAILQWATEGCLKWQQQGLNPPTSVVNAVEEYRSNMDTIGQWLDECCRFGPGLVTPSGTLYSSYKTWVLKAGHGPMSQKRLGETLRMRDLKNVKVNGVRSWQGVAIDLFKSTLSQGSVS